MLKFNPKYRVMNLVKGSVFGLKMIQSKGLSTNLEVLKFSKHFQYDSEPWNPKSMTISSCGYFESAFMTTPCHSYKN